MEMECDKTSHWYHGRVVETNGEGHLLVKFKDGETAWVQPDDTWAHGHIA